MTNTGRLAFELPSSPRRGARSAAEGGVVCEIARYHPVCSLRSHPPLLCKEGSMEDAA